MKVNAVQNYAQAEMPCNRVRDKVPFNISVIERRQRHAPCLILDTITELTILRLRHLFLLYLDKARGSRTPRPADAIRQNLVNYDRALVNRFDDRQ